MLHVVSMITVLESRLLAAKARGDHTAAVLIAARLDELYAL
jgi:hypothetical protein